MTVENGNGELAQLVQIKRAYKKSVVDLETELKVKYEQELANGRRRLKEQYLENIVDAVFSESPALPPTQSPAPTTPPKPIEVTEPPVKKCPDCGSQIEGEARFCPFCAFPLEEEKKPDASEPVAVAGRKFRTRVSRSR
jgi:hypothetical protein